MMSFTDTTVLVMGGGSGVGPAIARSFADHGARVLIPSGCTPGGFAILTDLADRGDRVDGSAVDLDRLFESLRDADTELDVIVTNASDPLRLPLETSGAANDLNEPATYLRRVAELGSGLLAERRGCLVNVLTLGAGLSADGVLGRPDHCGGSLTRYLATFTASRGIRVNTVAATLIDEPIAAVLARSDEVRAAVGAAGMVGQSADVDTVTAAVLFLASAAAAPITGQLLLLDNGISLNPVRPELAVQQVDSDAPAEPAAPPVKVAPQATEHDAGPPVDVSKGNIAVGGMDTAVGGMDTAVGGMDRIAVVGMGVKVPRAADPAALYRLLLGDQPVFSEPGARWNVDHFYAPADSGVEDSTYQRKSGYIEDATDAGIPVEDYTSSWLRHSLVQALDGVRRTEHDRHLFVVGYTADGSQHLEESMVWESINARLVPELDSADPAVIAALADLRRLLPHASDNPAASLPHRVGSQAADGILPADTELVMVDTACSSSLYSLSMGMRALRSGTCDIAACGASFAVGPRNSMLFASLHGLSSSGDIRSFDQDADGVLFSDGAAVVILKTLERARADGDTILGVLAGAGTSSDGRGRAIYAPNPRGQQLAVQRAFDTAGVTAADIDWVVAHATGTRAGDQAEIQTLKTSLADNPRCFVTSNKSLVGHTGWVAGIVSLIHVLEALRHELIPGQRRFTRAPAEWKLDESTLVIPTTDIPWPRTASPRTAAISGFGFGGTNAHLVVREHLAGNPQRPAPTPLPDDPAVLVGWSAELPGSPDQAGVADWLRGAGSMPPLSFGSTTVLPPAGEFRIPSSTLNTIDRCQLMALQCVRRLEADFGPLLQKYRDTTGVIAGHMGPTRNGVGYALRTYLRHLQTHVTDDEPLATVREAFGRYAQQVRALVPASNEDSSPGIMPNIIPARIANYFDFHGANMTVDTGFASTLNAVLVAADRLRDHELDIALVLGINGNNTPELRAILGDQLADTTELAEGAFLLAVTRRSIADREGLPVLAELRRADLHRSGLERTGLERSGLESSGLASTDPQRSTPGAGGSAVVTADEAVSGRSYLGAESAIGLLRSVVTGSTGTVTSRDPRTGRVVAVEVTPTRPATAPEPQALPVPATVTPHALVLRPCAAEIVRSGVAGIPENCLIVTNDPEALGRIAAPLGARMVSVTPTSRPEFTPLAGITDRAEFAAAVAPDGWIPRHVRVIAVLGAEREPGHERFEELLGLTDGALLAAQFAEPHLIEHGSYAALLLNAVDVADPASPVPRAGSGLLTGLVKSMQLELPSALVYAVVTDTRSLETGLAQLAAESRKPRHIPVAVYVGEQRSVHIAVPTPDPPHERADHSASQSRRIPLSRNSVVVAAGGSRGITAALLDALARRTAPEIWILGSTDIGSADPHLDPEPPSRADYLERSRAVQANRPLAELNQAYDRLCNVAEARRTLRGLAALCGPDRVHYRRCDLNDADAVGATMAEILDSAGNIDLLLNGAGISRTALLRKKKLSEFREVRDVKARGYSNLRRALAENRPRLWCNLGSILGFSGQLGEVDYTSANDFLNTCAAHSRLRGGFDEITIGWTLWDSIGLAASPIARSFFKRSGLSAGMSTAEGIQLFLAELDRESCIPVTVHLGGTERTMLENRFPGIRGAMTDAASAATVRPKPVAGGGGGGTAHSLRTEPPKTAPGTSTRVEERTLDRSSGDYLTDHRVDGRPTLPGTFGLQLAVEGARRLVPDDVLVGFESVVFTRFIRLHPTRGTAPIRITSELAGDRSGRRRVHVRVTSDVVAPTGAVLVKDQLHFELDVLFADRPLRPPPWSGEPTTVRVPVPDPYILPNPAVALSGVLDTLRDTAISGNCAEARFALSPIAHQQPYRGFEVPALLLDGLARTSVLTMRRARLLPLMALSSIERIELFGVGNDSALFRAFPDIRLFSRPTVGTTGDTTFGCVAVAADGRMLTRITGLAGILIGRLDPSTGDFVGASARDRTDSAFAGPVIVGAAGEVVREMHPQNADSSRSAS